MTFAAETKKFKSIKENQSELKWLQVAVFRNTHQRAYSPLFPKQKLVFKIFKIELNQMK